MSKWTTVDVKQELVEQVENEIIDRRYKSLSDFVSEAIQIRLQTLLEKRKDALLRPPKIIGVRQSKCINKFTHDIKIVKYGDSSVWITCPMFGWYIVKGLEEETPKLGCKVRKKHCTWFVG